MNFLALDTTYPPNGGLADCQEHIHHVLDFFALDTTYPPNGGLADCQGHIRLLLVFFVFLLFLRLIDCSEALDTTYPPNGGLADCPRLIPSVDSFCF